MLFFTNSLLLPLFFLCPCLLCHTVVWLSQLVGERTIIHKKVVQLRSPKCVESTPVLQHASPSHIHLPDHSPCPVITKRRHSLFLRDMFWKPIPHFSTVLNSGYWSFFPVCIPKTMFVQGAPICNSQIILLTKSTDWVELIFSLQRMVSICFNHSYFLSLFSQYHLKNVAAKSVELHSNSKFIIATKQRSNKNKEIIFLVAYLEMCSSVSWRL